MQDNDEEPQDLSHIPFDDDDEAPPSADRDERLRLSGLDDSRDASAGVSIGGLLDDDDEEIAEAGGNETNEPIKRKAAEVTPKPRKKRRKRRRVVIDNEESELSNDHIREMLNDTSDIVSRQRHPADADDEEDDEDVDVGLVGGGNRPKSNSEWEETLTRPFFADDGQLPDGLLRMWKDNYYRALGQPSPYDLLDDGENDEEEDDDSVEQARRQDGDEESEPQEGGQLEQNDGEEGGANGEEEPQDEGFVMMPDDEEDEPAAVGDDDQSESHIDSLASTSHVALVFVSVCGYSFDISNHLFAMFSRWQHMIAVVSQALTDPSFHSVWSMSWRSTKKRTKTLARQSETPPEVRPNGTSIP